MAARLTRQLVVLGLLLGAALPSSAAAAVVRPPTSQETGASTVPDRRVDPAYASSYFGARYYRAEIGRFTTIDPVYTWKENLTDPQRWNRYAYVRNNPLRYVDPDGREPVTLTVTAAWGAYALAVATTGWLMSPKGREAREEIGRAGHDAWNAAVAALARGIDVVRDGLQTLAKRYEDSPKHGAQRRGNVSARPTNGQEALDNSVVVKDTSPRRVGIDAGSGEIVVLDQTQPGQYHGHVRTWDELTDEQRKALINNGLTDRRAES